MRKSLLVRAPSGKPSQLCEGFLAGMSNRDHLEVLGPWRPEGRLYLVAEVLKNCHSLGDKDANVVRFENWNESQARSGSIRHLPHLLIRSRSRRHVGRSSVCRCSARRCCPLHLCFDGLFDLIRNPGVDAPLARFAI